MGKYKPIWHPDNDGKTESQRPKGSGSISKKARPDGRFKVSVPRADGKGRRYGYVRTSEEQEAKVRELLNTEAGVDQHGDDVAEHLDAMMETWRTARDDPEKRDWVIRQWLKLFSPPAPGP